MSTREVLASPSQKPNDDIAHKADNCLDQNCDHFHDPMVTLRAMTGKTTGFARDAGGTRTQSCRLPVISADP